MKNLLLGLTLLLATLLFGCQQSSNNTSTPAAAPTVSPQAASNTTTGTVIETMNSQGYTYVLVDSGNDQIWAATAQFEVNEGDMVVVPEGMPMHNYTSPSLNRDFEVVYFVESILNASQATAAPAAPAAGQMPAGHPPVSGAEASPKVELNGIEKLDGGLSIEEIFAARNELSEQDVSVRGKVVKFSPQIMGTNWIHLQDGSGNVEEGTHDLTVTSDAQPQVGDIVVVTGAVTVDKDFGHGYFYNLILENAAITVE